jgi:Rap1a immunity proteins
LKKAIFFFLLLAFCFGSPLKADERQLSGNDVLAACRLAAEKKVGKNVPEAYLAGNCSGMVETLLGVGSHLEPNMRFCVPDDVILLQGPKVVVRFLETHPERRDEPALFLAMDALRSGWPCPGNAN